MSFLSVDPKISGNTPDGEQTAAPKFWEWGRNVGSRSRDQELRERVEPQGPKLAA